MWCQCDSLHWKCYIPEIHQNKILRLLDISWYKFKLRFCLTLTSETWICRIQVSRSGEFLSRRWGCSNFSGICHSIMCHFAQGERQRVVRCIRRSVRLCCYITIMNENPRTRDSENPCIGIWYSNYHYYDPQANVLCYDHFMCYTAAESELESQRVVPVRFFGRSVRQSWFIINCLIWRSKLFSDTLREWLKQVDTRVRPECSSFRFRHTARVPSTRFCLSPQHLFKVPEHWFPERYCWLKSAQFIDFQIPGTRAESVTGLGRSKVMSASYFSEPLFNLCLLDPHHSWTSLNSGSSFVLWGLFGS
jgi:hypothetical protein